MTIKITLPIDKFILAIDATIEKSNRLKDEYYTEIYEACKYSIKVTPIFGKYKIHYLQDYIQEILNENFWNVVSNGKVYQVPQGINPKIRKLFKKANWDNIIISRRRYLENIELITYCEKLKNKLPIAADISITIDIDENWQTKCIVGMIK